jgi:hypothetical protein
VIPRWNSGSRVRVFKKDGGAWGSCETVTNENPARVRKGGVSGIPTGAAFNVRDSIGRDTLARWIFLTERPGTNGP